MIRKDDNAQIDIMVDLSQQQFQPMIKLDRFLRDAELHGIFWIIIFQIIVFGLI